MVLAATVVTLLAWRHFTPRLKLDYSFASGQVSSWTGAMAIRWRPQPEPNLVVAEKHTWYEFNHRGRLLRSWSSTNNGTVASLMLGTDADGDGFEELFTSWTKGSQAAISRWRRNLDEQVFVVQGGELHAEDLNREVPTFLRPMRLLPNGFSTNDHPKLLAFLYTNYNKRPRGLCCFDYASGRLLWQRLVGPPLLDLEVADLNGDGILEIICASASPCNGNIEPEAGDDSHAYIFAFSAEGAITWHTPVRDNYGGAEVKLVDLDSDGRPELLAHAATPPIDHLNDVSVLGRLVQLDPASGEIGRRYEPRTCLLSWLPFREGGNGPLRILCTDCEGFLHVLNTDLTQREKRPIVTGMITRPGTLDRREFILRGTAILRKNHSTYIVATTWDTLNPEFHEGRRTESLSKLTHRSEAIIILDSNLNLVTRYEVANGQDDAFAWVPLIVDLDADGVDEILLLSDRVDVLRLAP